MNRSSASDLVLDESSHVYRWRGRVVPGLTEILRSAGMIVSRGSEADLTRGSAVHLATRFYDEGRLDWTTVDRRITGYVQSWIALRRLTGLVTLWIERSVYCRAFGFATTLDRRVALNGRSVLLEIKTGHPEAWVGAQLEGHKLATGVDDETLVARLHEDGSVASLIRMGGTADRAVLMGAIARYHWERQL